MRSLWAPRLRRPFDLEPCGIEGREKEDRERGGDRQPAHDGDRLGPEEVVARQRDHGQDGRRRGQQDGPETPHRRFDDGGPGVASGLFVLFDLIDEDHRVAHDHAGQRDDAEQGHEAEGCPEQQQGECRADHSQGRRDEHQEGPGQILQLHHQQDERRDHHQRDPNQDGLLGDPGVLLGRAGFDEIAGRQLFFDGFELRDDLRRHIGCQHPVGHVGSDRDRRKAVAAPAYAVLEHGFELDELGQRCRSTVGRPNRDVGQSIGRDAQVLLRSPHDVDELVVLAELPDGDARIVSLQRLREA